MKKLFFYSIFLLLCIFTNCKKAEYNPKHNQLIVVDQKGNRITCKPVDSGINGSSADAFDIYTTGLTIDGFDFNMTFRQGIPNPIIFKSTGVNQGVTLYINNIAGDVWTASKGTAHVEVENSNQPTKKCPKFSKVTFNNVEFIINQNNFNPTGISDTLLVSGVISAHSF